MSMRCTFEAVLLAALFATTCAGQTAPPAGVDATGRGAVASPHAASPGASPAAAPERDPSPAVLARGLAIYAKQCAACHGDKGLGDGKAAYLLYPKPRNFASGAFRLTSTESGLPSDDDLLATLRRGMPGSAMPPWSHLPEADLRALVATIRHLAVEGSADQLLAEAGAHKRSLSREEALKSARRFMRSGPPVALPPRPAGSDRAALLARGAKAFLASCAACHDKDGRGRLKTDLKDDDGVPIFARDFTRGVFKGAGDEATIALRIFRGMPGSPMPANALPAADLWALASYVRSFVPAGVEAQVDRRQRALTARRVAGPLGTDPAAPVWKRIPSTFLPVAPLWWRNDRITGVELQAVHDGARLALRLRWADATPDELVLSQTAFGDGAAIELSNEVDPPFFGMGASGETVNIWHWKAAWQRDLSQGAPPPTLAAAFPGIPSDEALTRPGSPSDAVFTTGVAAGNPLSQQTHASVIEDLSASGFGTLTSRGPAEQKVKGAARYADGGWEVVFLRALGPAGARDVGLVPGETMSIALAVWDGSAGDRNGQKSVTIWHRLALER